MRPPKNDKARKAWLASLKDGDEVAVQTEYSTKIATVHRSARHEGLRVGGLLFTVASGKQPGFNRWIVPVEFVLLRAHEEGK